MSDEFPPPPPSSPPPPPPTPGQPPKAQMSVPSLGKGTGVFGTPKDLTFWVLVGSAVLIFLGSFLPWAKVTVLGYSATASGTDGDGKLTIILAIGLGVGIGLMRAGLTKPASIVAVVCTGLVGLIALYDMVDIDSTFGNGGYVGASVGFGLLLVGFAAFVGFVTSLIELLAAFGVVSTKSSDAA